MTPAPVAIFAHNEERNIRATIESVLSSFVDQAEFEPVLYVLVNGSTDGTVSIVRELAARNASVRLVEIALGDKSGAWNHYVTEVAPRANAHIFMDGDVTMSRGAGPELLRVLGRAPEALACVALPAGGRHSEKYRREIISRPTVWGNLYALKDAAIQLFRDKGVRLPVGHIGEDGLVGFLVAKDLDPRAAQRPERTVAAERANFIYPPMRWFSPHDIRKYFFRRINYSVRFYQFQFLGPRMRSAGIAGMPRHIVDLYGDMDTYKRPIRGGFNLIFDLFAWRRMKRARDRFRSAVVPVPIRVPVPVPILVPIPVRVPVRVDSLVQKDHSAYQV